MAGKFVDLKEAAKILGVTADDLVEMRSRGEIFGYRDGASWKFKIEEVERVASERSAAGRSGTGSGVLALDDEDFDNMTGSGGPRSSASDISEDSVDSVLVSDAQEGSSITRQSTVIGKSPVGKKAEDSDLQLASGTDLAGNTPKSSLSGLGGPAVDLGGSDVLSLGDSKLGTSLKGSSKSGSDKKGGADAKLHTPPGDSSILGDLQITKPGSGTGAMGGDAENVDLDITSGSGAYALSEDSSDDDEISLDAAELKKGPGTGSDVTYTPSDSGIGIRSPSDSGLSLDEEPLDLGGSGVDQLELPEDDDVISLEEEVADADLATQLKADEAFSLSPASADGGPDDESDSGSQVIALEDSSAFDQTAATMLSEGAAAGALMPEGAFGDMPMPGFDMNAGVMPAAVPGMQPQQQYVVSAPPETPYSVWNVLGLMATAGVLAISGMLMWDVVLNLWSYDAGTTVSTSLMEAIIGAFGLSK
jgi:excisionase family DNA binding protein